MRLARVLLLLALSGAVAHADDAKPADAKPAETHAKVPLRVVRMLPDTHQALLFDRTKGTHVVVEAGQAVEGLLVDSIDDDEVTLLSDNGATFVLAAPEPAWKHHRDDGHATEDRDGHTEPNREARATATSAKPAEPQPADPYADVAAPSTIGTGADGVRVVEAADAPSLAPTTIGTGADGVRVVEAPGTPAAVTITAAGPAMPAGSAIGTAAAPVTATAAAPAPATVPATATVSVPATATATATVPATATVSVPAAASAAAPAGGDAAGDALAAALTGAAPVATAPAATTATATADGPTVLPRADVTAALNNFGTLASSIRAAFTPAGVRVDSVATGSLFARAGLRAGDVIASVNGQPLRSLDDAADLYARAASARNVNVAILRAGQPVMLRVAIQ